MHVAGTIAASGMNDAGVRGMIADEKICLVVAVSFQHVDSQNRPNIVYKAKILSSHDDSEYLVMMEVLPCPKFQKLLFGQLMPAPK